LVKPKLPNYDIANRRVNWNISRAAMELGLKYPNLSRKLKSPGIKSSIEKKLF
jgi:transcriptional regulator of acetoin/glycerol metabolism